MNTVELILRRYQTVVTPERYTDALDQSGVTLAKHVAALQMNLARAGYVLDGAVVDALLPSESGSVALEDFNAFGTALIAASLKARRGNKKYEPFYPNFPQQVIDASEGELILNAVLHYLGDAVGLRIMPEYEKKERPYLDELRNVKTLGLCFKSEVDVLSTLFTTLTSQKTVYTPQDESDLKFVYKWLTGKGVEPVVAASIPVKENLAFLVGMLGLDTVLQRVKTITDVLRVAAAVSGGNPALTQVVFGPISRGNRKSILAALNRFEVVNVDEVAARRSLWKLLGEKLHPGEFAARYPNAYKVFELARSKGNLVTTNSAVENALASRNVLDAVNILEARPGVFARRLDELLRVATAKDAEIVVDAFAAVAGKVSTTVLWQLRTHMLSRGADKRVFFPKGSAANAQVVDNTLPAMDAELVNNVVAAVDAGLAAQYQDKESLGKVWVDPELKLFAVPGNVREASKALNTVGRGTVLPLDLTDKDTVRFFIWWKDGHSRTDIDLSALLVNKDFSKVMDSVTYYHLRSNLGAVHSGDITSAPRGASEFIDVPVKKLRDAGVRYVVPTIMSFTTQPFCDLPECYAGVMVRGNANKGEVYEPSSVEQAFDVASDSKVALPMIIDLEKGEAVWMDASLTSNSGHVVNVRGNSDALLRLSQGLMSKSYPSLYDLFTVNAAARGELADSKDDADTVFEVVEGKPSVAYETVLADFL